MAGLFISGPMTDRVVVFIDWQNLLMAARRAFHPARAARRSADGQIDPVALCELLCDRPPHGQSYELGEVRIYRGEPNPDNDPRMHAAHTAQREAWERAGARVITRPMQYIRSPGGRGFIAREKGIDVQLAVDLITGASDDLYDVGIVFSGDTDLRPALEYVAHRFAPTPRVEVAAWDDSSRRRRTGLTFSAPYRRWCHYLSAADYQSVRDLTSYAPQDR